MNSSITLPTDNIYKFFAFFGLLLIITASTLFVVSYSQTNERIYQFAKDISQFEGEEVYEGQKVLVEVINNQIEIIKSDRKFYTICLSIMLLIGGSSSLYGFKKWYYEIQPVQDKLLKLQIHKLQKELGLDTESYSAKESKTTAD